MKDPSRPFNVLRNGPEWKSNKEKFLRVPPHSRRQKTKVWVGHQVGNEQNAKIHKTSMAINLLSLHSLDRNMQKAWELLGNNTYSWS